MAKLDAATDYFTKRLFELQKLIDRADLAYYRPGCAQIMTDAEYDLLRPELKKLDPHDIRVTRVGCPYDVSELRSKTPHTIPMGSLDNTDDGIAGYSSWYDKTCDKLGVESVVVMASLKIDGGSIRARYVEGKLIEVVTRGNGEVGENITVNGALFRDLPSVLPFPVTIDVRGEAIMQIEDFKNVQSRDSGMPFNEIPESEQSNPRNIGNGVFSRDSGKDADKMRFIAFNSAGAGVDNNTEEEKFNDLTTLGFSVVPHIICKSIKDLEDFYDTTLQARDLLKYEIDGLVVCLNSIEQQDHFVTKDIRTRLLPKYAKAIKFPHKSGITRLESVLFSVGHTGSVVPTGVLREVRIGGVNVTHALLNNWDEIERLDVAIGDEVEVILAGDIIPKVIRVVTKDKNRVSIDEPKRCPVCGEPTSRNYRGKNGAVTYCSQPHACPAAMLGKINHWIGTSKKGTGIMEIGDTILKAIWDHKLIEDAADLYTLTVDQLKDIELDGGGRIGESRAIKIVANIAVKKHLPLHIFLGSLGVDLLGRRRVQILRENAGGELDKLSDWLDFKKLHSIDIVGFGDSIRTAVINGIDDCIPLIQKLASVGVTIDYPDSEPSADENAEESKKKLFDGISFCFTGTRTHLTETEELGGIIKSGISKKLDILVQKDATSSSNKTLKAEKYGVQIISVAYLKRLIDGEVVLLPKE